MGKSIRGKNRTVKQTVDNGMRQALMEQEFNVITLSIAVLENGLFILM